MSGEHKCAISRPWRPRAWHRLLNGYKYHMSDNSFCEFPESASQMKCRGLLSSNWDHAMIIPLNHCATCLSRANMKCLRCLPDPWPSLSPSCLPRLIERRSLTHNQSLSITLSNFDVNSLPFAYNYVFCAPSPHPFAHGCLGGLSL